MHEWSTEINEKLTRLGRGSWNIARARDGLTRKRSFFFIFEGSKKGSWRDPTSEEMKKKNSQRTDWKIERPRERERATREVSGKVSETRMCLAEWKFVFQYATTKNTNVVCRIEDGQNILFVRCKLSQSIETTDQTQLYRRK